MNDFDVVIVGGGLAGLALLNKINKNEARVLLLDDSKRKQQPSSRPLVLTAGNAAWLDYKSGYALNEVKISIAQKPGILRLQSEQHGLENFGYVVDAVLLQKKLLEANREYIRGGVSVIDVTETADNVSLILSDNSTISTDILVAADGAGSSISRGLAMPKVNCSSLDIAIMPNVSIEHTKPAQLRFVAGGTLAFLPTSSNTGTIVATGSATNSNMQQLWARHLPLLSEPVNRINYQQECFYLANLATKRVVFIGNAAHNLPPVGAQGFNLTCSTIADLANDFALDRYKKVARLKVLSTFNACDFLIKQNHSKVSVLSGLGLMFLGSVNFLKSEVIARGMQKHG